MTDQPTPRTEPTTEAAKRLMLLLAESNIAWPDDYTRIAISALTPMFAAIEAEAAAQARTEALDGLDADLLRRVFIGDSGAYDKARAIILAAKAVR